MTSAYGDMGTKQGIRGLENGVAIGGKFRVFTGDGTPSATFSAKEIGDLYLDYTNAVLYIAGATGTGSWTAYAGLSSLTGPTTLTASAAAGLLFSGTITKGIDFSGGTFTQGAANACMAYGDINTTKNLTPTDSIVSFQCNITSVADSGTSGDQTIGATYFRTACSTAHQPNHQLATCMVRVKVAKNIWDAYGVQSHLSFGTVTVETTGAYAHLTAISGKVTFDTTTVTKGWVTAGLFIIEGAGTCSQRCHGVSIVEEAGSTGAQSLLHLNTDVGTTPYLSLAGADGTGKSIYTHTAPPTITGTFMILVNGAARYIPFASAE